MNSNEKHEGKDHPKKSYKITIDRDHYEVHQDEMTGAEIRQLPYPPIGSDRDLFQVVPGGSDQKIGDADIVEIHEGMRFFTAPSQINPGNEPA